MIRLLLLCMVLLSGEMAEAQAIDFSRIKQRKVRKLMAKNQLAVHQDFHQMEAACSSDDASFLRNTKSFLVEASPEKVWAAYRNSSPRQSWGGKLVSFGVLFDAPERPLVYADAPYGGLKPGQIVFIQLRLLKGLYKLAVAHKVVAVDEEQKRLQICYLRHGASEGSQFIHLQETPEGHTVVTHDTFYRSNSKFRDKRIYPGIHEKVITEYHSNVLRSIRPEALAHAQVNP